MLGARLGSIPKACAQMAGGLAPLRAGGAPAAAAAGAPAAAAFRMARLAGALAPGAAAARECSAAAAAAAAASTAAPPTGVADVEGYQLPPQALLDIIDARPEPVLSFSPDRTRVLELERPPPHPPVSELAREELKLAGVRVDPQLFGRSRTSYYTSMTIAPFSEALVLPLRGKPPGAGTVPITGIPAGMWINYASWAPDGAALAFTLRSAGGAADPPRGPLQLWVADAATGAARPLLGGRRLNTVFENYAWVDGDTIVAAVVPEGRAGAAPAAPATPLGPRIEDNSGGSKAAARTFQDLLQSRHDEALFDHHCQSLLVSVKLSTGAVTPLGPPDEPRLYTGISPSPGAQFLLVSWLERPYSYALPCGRFPKRVEVWAAATGAPVRTVAALPLADDVPIAFDSCRRGPRSVGWRDDAPAQLHWTEAQDGGDPDVAAAPRDRVFLLDARTPDAEPRCVAATDFRCGGVAWGRGDVALLYESEWRTRRSRVWRIQPDVQGAAPELLWDRNYEDAYTDPGVPMVRRTPTGSYVLALVDDEPALLLQGSGATPEGSRPFLDLFDLRSRETRRLWRAPEGDGYESLSSILSDAGGAPISLDGLRVLATKESVADPPQFYVKSFSDGGAVIADRLISDFPHPYPTLRGLRKELVKYTRADGVELNAKLYWPPGYVEGQAKTLPAILWAYPRDFKDKASAGQVRGSPNRFAGIGATSPLLWLARGYAVMDGPSFPVLGEGEAQPNDTYVEQLVASAEAAVAELGRRGVDTRRVAVGGHSYGAFMTAGLLAHSRLFACGVARSGAYNRTLTPMGFQSEERTLWQVPKVYTRMSPFFHADEIEAPLLLIHGGADNNAGTFVLQSERMYGALKGHGKRARLVVLPHESHGYQARESVLHCAAETDAWLEKYCAAPAAEGEAGKEA
jgi:dipeptidyl aminopeptidase/acylaminoacyl peptidase